MVPVVRDPSERAGGGIRDADQLQDGDEEDTAVGPVEGSALEVPLVKKDNKN